MNETNFININHQDVLENLLDEAPLSMFRAIGTYISNPQREHADSIDTLWKIFVQEENTARGKAPEHLVKPSGRFNGKARLGIFLHYPSFNTKYKNMGEAADPTSPCTRLLLKKGLIPGLYAIDQWELWHRRENRPPNNSPLRNNFYPGWDAPEAVKSIQYAFAAKCMDMSSSKVKLLFGKHVQNWYRKHQAE